jgi:hypothetical protein
VPPRRATTANFFRNGISGLDLDGPRESPDFWTARIAQVNPTEAEAGEGSAHLAAAGHDEPRSSRLAPVVTTAALPCLRTTKRESRAGVSQLYSNTPRRRKSNLLPKQNKTPHSTHRSATPPPASTSSSAAVTTARRLPLPAIAARPLPPPRAPRRESGRMDRGVEGEL